LHRRLGCRYRRFRRHGRIGGFIIFIISIALAT
jgi:hypothetical protein